MQNLDVVQCTASIMSVKKYVQYAHNPVQFYSAQQEFIQNTIKKANKALELSVAWKDIENPIGLVNKRASNIGNRLFQMRKLVLSAHKTVGEKGTGGMRISKMH